MSISTSSETNSPGPGLEPFGPMWDGPALPHRFSETQIRPSRRSQLRTRHPGTRQGSPGWHNYKCPRSRKGCRSAGSPGRWPRAPPPARP
eukprot:scaffold257886_cov44-Prasinocladus_malaysianus.AAC.1